MLISVYLPLILSLLATHVFSKSGSWPLHPNWEPTYNMSMSTIMMPCNTSGWFDAELAARYGIADFDWSNARDIWANSIPMDCGARLLEQAAQVKQRNSRTHVWVYRNLVKALSWYSDVSEKLRDPAYSSWFLRFDPKGSTDWHNGSWHSPPCTDGVCSRLYHSQDQTPQHGIGWKECKKPCDCSGVPCGEYLWDHRNSSLREWLVHHHVMGPAGMGSPLVSGMYFDDYWAKSGEHWADGPGGLASPAPYDAADCGTGPSEIQVNCLQDMGLSERDVSDLTAGWKATQEAALLAVVRAGGWVWQLFTNGAINTSGDPNLCMSAIRAACQPDSPQQTRMCYYPLQISGGPGHVLDAAGDVAKFLLVRGPYGFIGTGWVGCEPDNGYEGGHRNQTYSRPMEFDVDYGIPLGLCGESSRGVFSREYTHSVVSHNCITGKSSILRR